MTQVMIRHRLVTWFSKFEDPAAPGGINRREVLSHCGDVVDIPDDEIERIEGVNAPHDPPFFTNEQADAIKAGSYNGPEMVHVQRVQGGVAAPRLIENIGGEGPTDISQMSTEELADYIVENKLNVQQTVALAGDDLESIEKVLDAEGIAQDDDPRAGVVSALEKKMGTAVTP